MSRRPVLAALAALGVLGCITSYEELPLCSSGDDAANAPTLLGGRRPDTECRLSDEVEAYEQLLAWEVLRRSQWQFPKGVPLYVGIRPDRRVGPVCVGDAGREPSWNVRDRVASSLSALRAAEPAPACLANRVLDLTTALSLGSVADPFRLPLGTERCPSPRPELCSHQYREVCGYDRNGRGRSYRNACFACQDEEVVGFLDFHCRERE